MQKENRNDDTKGLYLIPYKSLGKQFEAELKLHKYFINQLVITQNEKLIGAIITSGEELALVYSEYKCEC